VVRLKKCILEMGIDNSDVHITEQNATAVVRICSLELRAINDIVPINGRRRSVNQHENFLQTKNISRKEYRSRTLPLSPEETTMPMKVTTQEHERGNVRASVTMNYINSSEEIPETIAQIAFSAIPGGTIELSETSVERSTDKNT